MEKYSQFRDKGTHTSHTLNFFFCTSFRLLTTRLRYRDCAFPASPACSVEHRQYNLDVRRFRLSDTAAADSLGPILLHLGMAAGGTCGQVLRAVVTARLAGGVVGRPSG
jgi:hypothetical protein